MDYIQDRNLKIALLQAADDRLNQGCPFICTAIEEAKDQHAAGGNPAERNDVCRAADELCKYIMDALSPHAYYSRWLYMTHFKIYDQYGGNGIKQGRIAWINWMIACYEEDIANYKETK